LRTAPYRRSNLVLTPQAGPSGAYESLPPFIEKIWQALKNVLHALYDKFPTPVRAWIQKVITFLQQDEQKIRNFIHALVAQLFAQATGWNHAKFLAVNGTTAVASGYNWWIGYSTGSGVMNNYIFDT
jgi:hypothetical protein